MTLLKLAIVFLMFSISAIGGGTALISEMQRELSIQYGISPRDFVEIYSVGQLAPGPNMTLVLILGMRIAGWLGALLVGLAFFVPAAFLCFWAGRLWDRIGETPWRRSVQIALEPISMGLMCSGVYALGKTALSGPTTIALAVVSFGLVMQTRTNPVFIILVLSGIGLVFMQISSA